jgi:hypothetical protein
MRIFYPAFALKLLLTKIEDASDLGDWNLRVKKNNRQTECQG